jgi:fucose permease
MSRKPILHPVCTFNKNYVEIGSAATAFLCGYLILKLKEGVNCDIQGDLRGIMSPTE